jgi:hypothetical protein
LLDNLSSADRTTQAQLLQRFKGERIAAAALAMKDKLYWAGDGGPDDSGQVVTHTSRPPDNQPKGEATEHNTDDFAMWVRGLGPEPTDASKMNCWESVMLSAYRSGVMPKEWIFKVHEEAARGYREAVPKYYNAKTNTMEYAPKGSTEVSDIWGSGLPPADPVERARVQKDASGMEYGKVLTIALGYLESKPVTIIPSRSATVRDKVSDQPGAHVPQRGDIVFFDRMSHVAISLGTKDSKGEHEIMSLWSYPLASNGNFNSHFQKTTIEAVRDEGKLFMAEITSGKAPW